MRICIFHVLTKHCPCRGLPNGKTFPRPYSPLQALPCNLLLLPCPPGRPWMSGPRTCLRTLDLSQWIPLSTNLVPVALLYCVDGITGYFLNVSSSLLVHMKPFGSKVGLWNFSARNVYCVCPFDEKNPWTSLSRTITRRKGRLSIYL